jgi:microcystin synthetase protein McyA
MENHERINVWQTIYDGIYARWPRASDPALNTAGWISRYDRKPIPEAQMRSWAQDCVARVLAESPRRVLEIGCGAGMLLFGIAPHCESYFATDISAEALRYVESILDSGSLKVRPPVTLFHRPAHDFSSFGSARFDTVLLNSVVQHFPDDAYLTRVLERAVESLEPGGRVYVGDVCDSALHAVLHAGVALRNLDRCGSVEALRQRIRQSIDLDIELTIGREYFWSLPIRLPRIRAVEIQLKRTGHDDEMSRFRYEAILHTTPRPTIELQSCVTWTASMSLDEIARRLAADKPRTLQFASIPNSAMAECLHAADLVESARSPDDLRARLAAYTGGPTRARGASPRQLVQLARDAGYQIELHASTDGDVAKLDGVFHRSDVGGFERPIPGRLGAPNNVGNGAWSAGHA